LRAAEVQAEEDQKKAMGRFRRWASSKVPGAENMNVGSGTQIRQLLFAGVQNQKPEKGSLELERVFKVGLQHFQQSTAVPSLQALVIAAVRFCLICGCSCTHITSSSVQVKRYKLALLETLEQRHYSKGRKSELSDSLQCTTSLLKCLLAAARHSGCLCVNLL